MYCINAHVLYLCSLYYYPGRCEDLHYHNCQFHCHPQSFDYHINGSERMQIVAPLYNFNDCCGPLGQIMAAGRVGTLRVSTVKNPGCLDESAMTEKVLDGMMRKHGSQDERCWFIMRWQPLAQQAVLIATTPPWPDSVLQINPLPEHFASISKVLGEMLKDPGFKNSGVAGKVLAPYFWQASVTTFCVRKTSKGSCPLCL